MPTGSVFTLPNIISFARLLLIPLFLWLLLGPPDDPVAAGWLLAFIGATDWIDGYLARRLDQVSELGKMLDPLADRLAVAAALIGGLIAGVLPIWFTILLIIREMLVGGLALYLWSRDGATLSVRPLGKLATFLLYGAIAGFFVGNGGDVEALVLISWIAGIPGLILYYVVGVQYFGDARSLLPGAKTEQDSE